MKRFTLAACVALLVALPATALAGPPPAGEMQALPDAPTTEDEVVISNVSGDVNTCEDGVVQLFVEDDGGATVFDDLVEPDASGNWSQSLGTLPAGDYLAEADCALQMVVEEAVPARQPFFPYDDLEFSVTQAPPSSSTTTTTTTSVPASTTTARAAATATPRFTG